jgi:hypothetical protein
MHPGYAATAADLGILQQLSVPEQRIFHIDSSGIVVNYNNTFRKVRIIM